jgi:hypothetical protein
MKWLGAEKRNPEDYPDRDIIEAAKIILGMRKCPTPLSWQR